MKLITGLEASVICFIARYGIVPHGLDVRPFALKPSTTTLSAIRKIAQQDAALIKRRTNDIRKF